VRILTMKSAKLGIDTQKQKRLNNVVKSFSASFLGAPYNLFLSLLLIFEL